MSTLLRIKKPSKLFVPSKVTCSRRHPLFRNLESRDFLKKSSVTSERYWWGWM